MHLYLCAKAVFLTVLLLNLQVAREAVTQAPTNDRRGADGEYYCFGQSVDGTTHAALQDLALAQRDAVLALFQQEFECGGVFTLSREPTVLQTHTGTGKDVDIPKIETISGEFVSGESVRPYNCLVLGYWWSDFSQQPWTAVFSAQDQSTLAAIDFTHSFLWAQLSTDSGSCFIRWPLIAGNRNDSSRAVILLADGIVTDMDEQGAMSAWGQAQAEWGQPGGVDPGGLFVGPQVGPQIGPQVAPPGQPPQVKPPPRVPCDGNNEVQLCLDSAKDAYYDCMWDAYHGLEACLAWATAAYILAMAGCVIAGMTSGPL